MKKAAVIILAVLVSLPSLAQDVKEQRERKKLLEDEIAMIDKQLDTTARKRKESLNTLILTRRKLEARKKLIDQLDDDIAGYDRSISSTNVMIGRLNDRLDTTVTTAQINEYYEANRNVFRLAGPIVKARIARIPAGLRQSRKLEEMFRSTKEEDRNDFQNICQKNQYRTDDFSTEWTDFSTVIRHIPFSQSNFDEFLRSRSYYEVEDDQYKYMMAIDAFRPTGDYSPMERETENIRKIILNKRRQSLLTQLEDSLYTTARNNHQFEIKIKQ